MKLESKNRSQTYKKIVFANLGNKCKYCTETINLVIHHRDFDFNNNYLDNLLLLCGECHGNYHSYDIKLQIGIKQKLEIDYLLKLLKRIKEFISDNQYQKYLKLIKKKKKLKEEKEK